MKRLLVMLVVVIGIGVCAWGDVGSMLTVLVGDDCLTAEELQPILAAFAGDCSATLSVEGACTTVGELSAYLYDVLGLRGTLLQRLFGMTEAEKVVVCQRENVMVVGAAGDSLTGIDLAAIFVGVSRYLLHLVNPIECIALDMDALASLLGDSQALLPTGTLCLLIPGFCPPTPTS